MSKKLRIALLFGGRSAEHEVSIQSARNIARAMDKNKHEVVLVGIDKTGRWIALPQIETMLGSHEGASHVLDESTPSAEIMVAPGGGMVLAGESKEVRLPNIDVVFPVLHGPYGEDGTVQGLLKLANVPFVGAGVLGSAVGMDKEIMKRLLRDARIPIGRFMTIRTYERSTIDFARVVHELGSPLFVKPANLGSSVGVSRVENEAEFLSALDEAFLYDTKVLVEEYIAGREIECAVLGDDEHAEASIVGEVKPTGAHAFYSYESKYLDENGAALTIPAKLDEAVTARVQELAVQTFHALSCHGMARVDFFVKDGGEIFVNEINTIPGFTNVSMYPKLWQASGLSQTALIDKLIELAIKRHERETNLKTTRD